MKSVIKNNRKSFFGVSALAALCMLFLLGGCNDKFVMDLPLSVSQRAITLSSSAGSTHVLVYSTGEWKLKLTKDVNWASLDRTEGYGNNEFVFSYAADYGLSRNVGVEIISGELRDTIVFTQTGTITDPKILFTSLSANLFKCADTFNAGFTTDLIYSIDDFLATVTYYDAEGNAADPVQMKTRAADSEENEEDEEEDEEEEVVVNVDPWISNIVISSTSVSFDVTENTTGAPRVADLRVYTMNGTSGVYGTTLTITQSTDDPQFVLESSTGTYEYYEQSVIVPATANNLVSYADDISFDVTYSGNVSEEDEWIGNVAVTSEGLTFDITTNEGEDAREAVIDLAFSDNAGNSVAASFSVRQIAYDGPVSFEKVRGYTPGQLTIDDGFIEGYIVSDINSMNVVSAPQTGQFQFDRTENTKTAYIESTDGKYGFCLKYATADDNTLERFSKVQIALNGLTLTKNSDPEYYTLSGVTADNIIDIVEPDEESVPVKTKAISEITDDDIFTLTSVPNLEIMCKDGCYTNASDGYSYKDSFNSVGQGSSAVRWDVAPLICYDKAGNSINMLTNAGVPWRRDGVDLGFYSIVPQGSGTFRGIVVCDEVVTYRYGDVGRYQLRAMVEEDIDLNEDPFSNTIVEWTWDDQVYDLIPETGAGTINVYDATAATVYDFNNTVCSGNGGSSGEQKGLVATGGMQMTNTWWDFDNNVGKYFEISFSTTGLSGSSMIFGMTWGTGNQNNTTIFAPSHWKLLYSVDGGSTFNEVNSGDILKERSVAWWTTTTQDAPCGLTEVLRKLPSDCFGKSEVVLRIQAADTVNDIVPSSYSTTDWWSNCGCELGNITSSTTAAEQMVRIGTITVRYN